jgi:hypothetical protein
MGDRKRPPFIHALIVAWAVLGTFILIVGLLYLLAASLVLGPTPY